MMVPLRNFQSTSMCWRPSMITYLLVILALSGGRGSNAADGSSEEDVCGDYSLPWKTSLSSLTPNTMVKICGSYSTKSATLSQPTCGDGTPFGFFVARPTQKLGNAEKIMIEVMGGGACWDSTTCQKQSAYLTFPDKFHNFIGLSCTEIAKGLEQSNQNSKLPISMLCARNNFGNQTDLTSYNTVIVPYCTQDVHVGDNIITYDDGTTVKHRGGHNLYSVARWIFANFLHPKHIILTGCSAGGTALPILYDLLDQHYNVLRVRNVQINVLMDSPVYLTPSYFLENAMDHWNPSTLMERIGFPYYKYRLNTDYPTKILDHVLKRGSNRDRWGFITHTSDPVSLVYYQWMSGQNGNRRLANDDDSSSSQWWTELSDSLEYVKDRHKNVQTYFMDSQGHCSFGLYYALQQDGFEEWAASIIKEDALLVASTRPGVIMFGVAVALGMLVATGGMWAASQLSPLSTSDHQNDKKEELLTDGMEKSGTTSRLYFARNILAWIQPFAFSAGYMVATTVYFGAMLISEGFAHPLNNPSLGPSAISLSAWGILNPSLVVYKHQVMRLLTSSILCSGILTYVLTMTYFSSCLIHLEKVIGSIPFAILFLLIALGPNLLFCFLWDGATCSTLSVMFGLLGSYIWLLVNSRRGICCLSTGAILAFVIASFIFAFNSWVVMVIAFFIGWRIPSLIFASQEMHVGASFDADEREKNDDLFQFQKSRVVRIRRKPLLAISIIYVIAFFMLLFKVRHPNRLYTQPFYTGCDLKYTDQVGTLGSYYNMEKSSHSNGGRRLDDTMDEVLCAQFCVPHLVSRLVSIGADQMFGLAISPGTCQEAGYDAHVADKTFRYFLSYSLDVEIYVSYDTNE